MASRILVQLIKSLGLRLNLCLAEFQFKKRDVVDVVNTLMTSLILLMPFYKDMDKTNSHLALVCIYCSKFIKYLKNLIRLFVASFLPQCNHLLINLRKVRHFLCTKSRHENYCSKILIQIVLNDERLVSISTSL